MENKHTNGPWEDRAIRLEFQLRRLIYGYRISGVDALKSEEWKILYDIAEAILVEGNPIASAPSLQSEIDRLKEEKKDLLEALQDIFDTLSSDDTVITQFLPECDSTYKPSGWLSKAKELLTRIK